MCEGRRVCYVDTKEGRFLDACPGEIKYLHVVYKCVRGEDNRCKCVFGKTIFIIIVFTIQPRNLYFLRCYETNEKITPIFTITIRLTMLDLCVFSALLQFNVFTAPILMSDFELETFPQKLN